MADLTDERVREIAGLRGFRISHEEGITLARMVLDLQAQLAAVPTCACGNAFGASSLCIKCTSREVDECTREILADRDNLREFLGALVDVHVWDQGRFAETNAEAVFAEAVHRNVLVLDPHPQPCPIEECECGDYDGRMWRGDARKRPPWGIRGPAWDRAPRIHPRWDLDVTPAPLDRLMVGVRADPALRRCDRIALAFALLDDGFSARDIARVASIRKGLIAALRRSLGLPRPAQGAAATNTHHPDRYHAPRSLRVAVQSLRWLSLAEIGPAARRLGISELSAYAIWRAIPTDPVESGATPPARAYRCVQCEQLTPTHPCAHCGAAWLREAA